MSETAGSYWTYIRLCMSNVKLNMLIERRPTEWWRCFGCIPDPGSPFLNIGGGSMCSWCCCWGHRTLKWRVFQWCPDHRFLSSVRFWRIQRVLATSLKMVRIFFKLNSIQNLLRPSANTNYNKFYYFIINEIKPKLYFSFMHLNSWNSSDPRKSPHSWLVHHKLKRNLISKSIKQFNLVQIFI